MGLIRSGLDWNELARRCHYINLNKGSRRLRALAAGDLRNYESLRNSLADALKVDVTRLDAAAEAAREETRRVEITARRAAHDAWRKAFVPHVMWKTELRRPISITCAALIEGNGRMLKLPEHENPLDMIAEAVKRCPAELPLWGKVTGFYLNLSPDLSLEYNRSGSVVRQIEHANPEQATLSQDKRKKVCHESGYCAYLSACWHFSIK